MGGVGSSSEDAPLPPDRTSGQEARLPTGEVATAGLRTLWLHGVALLLALATAGCEDDLPAPQPRQEGDLRVVVILIDTTRADRLPPSQNEPPVTPFLDDLAQHSVVFRHAHSASSWTAPAVASLFTSLLPTQHGVRTGLFLSHKLGIDVNQLPDDVNLLPEFFQQAGYATLGVSDNVNISSKLGFDRGFDRFHEMNDQGSEEVGRVALEWLEEIQERSRTFLYLHFLDPHRPYNERSPWFEDFRGREEEREAAYDSEIRQVDAQIAQLFDRFGWDEDTLLVVLSDHGEEFGDHGGDDHGHTLYSELTDIPLLMYCPRIWPDGEIVDENVSIVDVLPTLAEICRLDSSPGWRGTSLLGVIDGTAHRPSPIYAHLLRRDLGSSDGGLVLRSAIFGQRKLILSNDGPRQLYDLSTDPHEQRDMATQWEALADALEGLTVKLEATMTAHPTHVSHIQVDQELRDQLRTLGYLDVDDDRP